MARWIRIALAGFLVAFLFAPSLALGQHGCLGAGCTKPCCVKPCYATKSCCGGCQRSCCKSCQKIFVHVCRDKKEEPSRRTTETGRRTIESGPAVSYAPTTVVPSMPMFAMPMMMPSAYPATFASYQQPMAPNRRTQEAGSASSSDCCSKLQEELKAIREDLLGLHTEVENMSKVVKGHGQAIEEIVKILQAAKNDEDWKKLLK